MTGMSVGDELRDLADRIEGHIAIAPHEIRGMALRADYVALQRGEAKDALASRDARLAAVEALKDEWLGWADGRSSLRIDAFRDAAEAL